MTISWKDLKKLDPTVEIETDKETEKWLSEIETDEEWMDKIMTTTPDVEAAQRRIDNIVIRRLEQT